MNIVEALRKVPQDYLVYARHVDSIYPIVGITVDCSLEGAIGFSSEETHGKEPTKTYTTEQLLREILAYMENLRLGPDTKSYLEAADNVDTELDMQMCNPCEIEGYGIDDICRLFLLIAGACLDYD